MRVFGYLTLVFWLAGVVQAADSSYFGKQESQGGEGLLGIIYDLKQTQQREPTGVVPAMYSSIIDDFLKNDWDESILNKYFRSARPLLTTQIFIPLMGAGNAPKAFGLENVMKPTAWIAHYKGQVSPPQDGVFRFVGYADDILAVGVNGKTVLVGARFNVQSWKSPERPGPAAANGVLTYGDWIEMKKDEPVDLDVLLGERPGAEFCAFLLYQKQGAEYPMRGQDPVLPIFQLAPFETPKTGYGEAPEVSPSSLYWKGHQ